jgi:hypothetical protein
LEFLGFLAKQIVFSLAGLWLFQGPRKNKPDATPERLENQSVKKYYTASICTAQRLRDKSGLYL